MQISLQFLKKHSDAFVGWEILNRAATDSIEEIPADIFSEMFGRDDCWLNNTISNARVRLNTNVLKSK